MAKANVLDDLVCAALARRVRLDSTVSILDVAHMVLAVIDVEVVTPQGMKARIISFLESEFLDACPDDATSFSTTTMGIMCLPAVW